MKLILRNGYPHPYPRFAPEFTQAAYAEAAGGNRKEIDGVHSVEVMHEFTVKFVDRDSMVFAQEQTGWEVYSEEDNILAAPTSRDEGYDLCSAIIVKDMAYCGFWVGE